MAERVSLAIVVSHPIQYFAPWHRELARRGDVRLRVFFSTDHGLRPRVDEEFGRAVAWDVPLLEGYDHVFLPRRRPARRLSFLGIDSPGVGAALSSFRPDVVLLHGYSHLLGWRTSRWCRRAGVPLMLYSDSNARLQPGGLRGAAKRLLVGRVYAHVDGAFCMGPRNRDYHASFGLPAERLFPGILPADGDGLRASVPDPGEARRRVRARLGFSEQDVVVLLCGKLSPRKRPGDLLDAVDRVQALGLPVRVLVVGEGELRPALEERCRDRGPAGTAFAGFVNVSGMGEHYAAADLLAFCAEREPYGLVVAEAGIFGLPAVVSDQVGCADPQDAARAGENALVYPCGDVERLADHLRRMADEPGLRARMGIRAREIAAAYTPAAASAALAAAAARLAVLGLRR